jgi:hypothetical protein
VTVLDQPLEQPFRHIPLGFGQGAEDFENIGPRN